MTWPLLAHLSPTDRDSLLAAGVVRTFKNRQVVFHTGDPADTMFVIQHGQVAVRVVTEYGDESTLVVLGEGDTFGELALLGADRKRAATVVAITDTTALIVSRAQLTALRENRPDIDQLVIDLLAHQVDMLTAELLEARYVPVRHRVARTLLRLYGQRDRDVTGARPVDLIITQDDIAGLVGAARPTVNQVLRSLESAGAIALHRGRIRVLDVDRLGGLRG